MMARYPTAAVVNRNPILELLLLVVVVTTLCWNCAHAESDFTVEHTKLLPIGSSKETSLRSRSENGTSTVKPNSVMIMLTEKYDTISNVKPIINRLIRGTGGKVVYYYNNTMKGASITDISPSNIVKLLNRPAIKYGSLISKASINGIQKNPVWGLDRIDQTSTVLDKQYSYNSTGREVTAYIIDTGVMSSHVDFEGRASCEFSSITYEEGCVDLNGHGTHVAGTIGGTKYGVAKRIKLVGIKVLDAGGSGDWDSVVAGIDYVTGIRKNGKQKPMVINMSLGGGFTAIVNMATNAAAQAGITVVVAAGNSYADACDFSPASSEKAISVGATEYRSGKDSSADFSNHGKCVEIFAPGVDVESAWIKCNDCTEKLAGTSMASPHVCGVAALYLEKNPYWKPHQVYNAMKTAATPGIINSIKGTGTPNLFLNMAGL